MNPDLVRDYFERDLSEAEDEALDALFRTSPESALRFAGLAEAAYQSFGLPEPKFRRKLKISSKTWMGLFALAAIGFIAWLYFVQNTGSSEPTVISGGTESAVVLEAERAQPQKLEPEKAVPVNVAAVQKDPVHAPAPLAPPPLGVLENAGKDSAGRSAMQVVVKRQASGLVTIRVLDQEKKEIRLLYTGVVEKGSWYFDWDGRKSDGTPAKFGTYRIEVKSGSVVQSKEVTLGDAKK